MKMTKTQQLTSLLYKLKVELGKSSKSLAETKSFSKILDLFMGYETQLEQFIDYLYERRYEPDKLLCVIEKRKQELRKDKQEREKERIEALSWEKSSLRKKEPLPSFEVFLDWEGIKDEGDFASFAVNKKTMELIEHELVSTEDDVAIITINRNEYEAARKSPEQFQALLKSKLPKN